MKIFSWVHRTFHHSVQKEGIGQNVKKIESVLNEADKQALLKQVELEDALHGWNGGILTIGTFGFETSKLSNQQKEYLVLESEEAEDEEGEKYFVNGEDTDSTEYDSVEDEELNPLMFPAFGPKIEVIGENGEANEKKTGVVLTVDGVHLSPFLGAYEMSFDDSKTMYADESNIKGDRITLADLFMADADAKMKMNKKNKKVPPRSNEKEAVRTKTGLSFAKKLIPRVKEDSHHPIKKIRRMMKKMLKKKIHPEIGESNNQIGEIKLVANSGIETFEPLSLLPTQEMDSSLKVYTFSQVKSHNHKKDCWLIISGKVYNVTSFLDDHPGGDEVLLLATEKDATNDFRSVGHSDNAKELMEKYCVGKIDPSTLPVRQHYRPPPPAEEHKPESTMGFSIKVLQLVLPLLILPLAFALHLFIKTK